MVNPCQQVLIDMKSIFKSALIHAGMLDLAADAINKEEFYDKVPMLTLLKEDIPLIMNNTKAADDVSIPYK